MVFLPDAVGVLARTSATGPAGTTIAADCHDGADGATEFTALTVHRYDRPLVSPVTATGDAAAVPVRIVPPLLDAQLASKRWIAEPDRFSGSTKLTLVDCPDGNGGVIAATCPGTGGAVFAIATAFDTSDSGPSLESSNHEKYCEVYRARTEQT